MAATPLHTIAGLIQAATIQQFAAARARLTAAGHITPEAIHEIRRSLKRMRAALRLVRDDLGPRMNLWNAHLRAVHHELSLLRDTDACQQTIASYAPRCSSAEQLTLERLSQDLEARRTARAAELDHVSRQALLDRLAMVEDGWSAWQPTETRFDLIAPAVKRMARRCRRLVDQLRKHPDSECFHSLRKEMKLRLYWLELLAPIWPHGMKAEERLVDGLSDLLGHHQDLEVLAEQFQQAQANPELGIPRQWQRLIKRLHARQKKLEHRILKLARRLTVERPRALCKRWRKLAGIWEESPEIPVRKPESSAAVPVPLRPRPR